MFSGIQRLLARSIRGNRINVLPTNNGLKLRPLDEQPEDTIDQMIARPEAGETSVKATTTKLKD